jgi:peptidyl-prolyl cis-trans isomerase D
VNKLTSILGGFAVIAVAIVFIINFRPNANQPVVDRPSCAIEVRGNCITPLHYDTSYRLAVWGLDSERARQLPLRRIVAEGLIERWLLNEDAKRLGITVSNDDLNAELAAGRARLSMPFEAVEVTISQGKGKTVQRKVQATELFPYLRLNHDLMRPLDVKNRQTGRFDLKTYEKQVRMIGKMSPQDFRDFQKEELVASRMRDLVRSRVQVGEQEAFSRYAQDQSTATIGFIRLDKRFYADLVADASKKAIDAWVALNKEEEERVWNSRKAQYTPECRVARHILAKVSAEAADQEAEKTKAKKKIDDAKARLDKGEDFAAVARELSEDGSAAVGGELGCVGKGKMVKPFEEAVFKAEEGKISDVVETQFGLHLVKVDKIAKDADAEALGRAEVDKEIYLAHESERLTAEAAKAILAAVRGGKTLDQALEAHMTELKAKGATGDAKDDKKAAKKAAKKDDKKSDKAAAKDGGGEKKDGGEDAGVITFDNHPQKPVVEASMPFNNTGTPIPGAAPGTNPASIAFKLEKPGDVPDDIVPLFSGYAVMQLKEKKPASKEEWEKDRVAFVANYRAQKEHDALSAYIARLKSTLGTEIQIHPEFRTESARPADEAGEDTEGL